MMRRLRALPVVPFMMAGVLVLNVWPTAAQQLAAVAAAPSAPRAKLIAAAGDIACDASPTAPAEEGADRRTGGCRQAATAALIAARRVVAVLPLGDEQYPDGTLAAFESNYRRSWGHFDPIVHPAPGNHEYGTSGAAGYFDYFGARAGDRSRGYYSFDLGTWHLIALNANCGDVGGCGAASAQTQWLRGDLARARAHCVLAFWHQPRFSSGPHHSDVTYQSFWEALYARGADIVLNGHDHDYERFAPQSPSGSSDSRRGIREFVVGTGGKSHYTFTRIEPNSEVRNDHDFGVLFLTLDDRAYRWEFVNVSGRTVDRGSGTCHG
jgi:calcineurin-like phosphoesterase family protein